MITRCALCPGSNTCVPPSGPTDCDYVFVGEAPGKQENKAGKPFIGNTGREVNEHYLPLAGLQRDNTYFTNAIRCLPISSDGRLDINRNKDLQMLDSCVSTHLYNELDTIRPKVIIPMGAFACHAIDPDIDLEMHHGMPYETSWGTAFPMWHPAGGVHEPKKMLQIRTDWVRFKRFIKGNLYIPQDQFPNPDYAEVDDPAEILELDPFLPMACDTENSPTLGPYCLTYSQVPGVARLIRANRLDLLAALQTKLDQWKSIIIFHNWMYDVKIVGRMGLYFPNHAIRDTMIRAFHLGNLPQKLKVLAFRLLGMTMQEFEDLVKPYSTIEVLKYYREAYSIEWPKPEVELIRGDDGMWETYKPQSLNTKLKRFFTDVTKNPKKDIFKTWDNWEDSQEMLKKQVGPYPGLDINHVPEDKILYYACRDSHATLLLWDELERLKVKAMQGGPQERWEI